MEAGGGSSSPSAAGLWSPNTTTTAHPGFSLYFLTIVDKLLALYYR